VALAGLSHRNPLPIDTALPRSLAVAQLLVDRIAPPQHEDARGRYQYSQGNRYQIPYRAHLSLRFSQLDEPPESGSKATIALSSALHWTRNNSPMPG
jgi:hypothetical protein